MDRRVQGGICGSADEALIAKNTAAGKFDNGLKERRQAALCQDRVQQRGMIIMPAGSGSRGRCMGWLKRGAGVDAAKDRCMMMVGS